MIKIKLTGGTSLGEATLRKFEERIQCSLPRDYRDFLQSFNGSTPSPNIFKMKDGGGSGVTRFIPLRMTTNERKGLDHVPPKCMPIAWAEGGNYVFLNLESGEVFFWDHELPSSNIAIARSFGAFLDSLIPFSVDDVQLNPKQIKRAWIDPDFLKEL